MAPAFSINASSSAIARLRMTIELPSFDRVRLVRFS
jgi:hypothetical protein